MKKTAKSDKPEAAVKPAKPRAPKVLNMPPADSDVAPASFDRVVDQDAIAQRAFELYCARGCQDGYDRQDWLTAERELRGAIGSSAAA
jgi:hypothetical protein